MRHYPGISGWPRNGEVIVEVIVIRAVLLPLCTKVSVPAEVYLEAKRVRAARLVVVFGKVRERGMTRTMRSVLAPIGDAATDVQVWLLMELTVAQGYRRAAIELIGHCRENS